MQETNPSGTVWWGRMELSTSASQYVYSPHSRLIQLLTSYKTSQGSYWHRMYRFVTMVRGGLIAIIYDQTMNLDTMAIKESEAVTLMSADIDRIANGVKNIHELWFNVIEAGIATWLLQRQIGMACLAMVGLSLGACMSLCCWRCLSHEYD
jgi:ATP-binding cassette subfamily C (CFTR/MRP) protein 1